MTQRHRPVVPFKEPVQQFMVRFRNLVPGRSGLAGLPIRVARVRRQIEAPAAASGLDKHPMAIWIGGLGRHQARSGAGLKAGPQRPGTGEVFAQGPFSDFLEAEVCSARVLALEQSRGDPDFVGDENRSGWQEDIPFGPRLECGLLDANFALMLSLAVQICPGGGLRGGETRLRSRLGGVGRHGGARFG